MAQEDNDKEDCSIHSPKGLMSRITQDKIEKIKIIPIIKVKIKFKQLLSKPVRIRKTSIWK